jgi:hypothetical protein
MGKQDRKTNPVILKEGMKIGGISAETDEDFLLECFQDYPAVEQCMP